MMTMILTIQMTRRRLIAVSERYTLRWLGVPSQSCSGPWSLAVDRWLCAGVNGSESAMRMRLNPSSR